MSKLTNRLMATAVILTGVVMILISMQFAANAISNWVTEDLPVAYSVNLTK